ncbi:MULTISPECIES: YkvA family protein [Microbacterium]|uniref:YkvA family protein n=1 Tax=Microbacterium TaxID=33882 RepID=UPI00146E8661|nr:MULTISPECIES: YkvA family protein [Microbacterium]
MFRFVRAIKRGEHRVAPTTWAAAITAAVYTVVPLDLIPELVLGPLGLADDAGIWTIFAVLSTREYARWRAGLTAK